MMKVNLTKMLSMLAIAAVIFATSCDDDEATPDRDVEITGIPATASIDNLGTLGPVTATINAPDGLDRLVITRNGVNFDEVDLSGTTATYDFTYTATAADEDSNVIFEFTATDIDGDSDDATHVLSVGAAVSTVVVDGNITSNTTWETGVTYILETRVTVLDGVTLEIEPGVIIKGGAGTGANSKALLVARGATLNAVGTPTEPIIMTSVADNIEPGMIDSPNLTDDVNGLWGGLIVLGNARISADNESEQIEGIPASDPNGLYGGTDDADNSGTIQYVSVRHGGTNIGEGNEINGITLGGVGNMTTIDHVEVIGNQDDGIEWFGGTVSISHALVWSNGDDAVDTDQAWAGTLDNFVVINPGDEAFELDGPEGAYVGAGHTITNGSVRLTESASGIVDFDDNSDVNMSNIFVFDIDETQDVEGYPGYSAQPNFGISNFESTAPFEYDAGEEERLATTTTLDASWTGGSVSEVTEVADPSAATVGADVSEFTGWSFADVKGALDDF